MIYSDLAETVLVEKAQLGKGEAFDELYRRYAERIYRYIYPRVNNRNDAEDLTGQVFLKAWEGLPKYEQRSYPFTSWLYKIAHNVVIDHYRRSKPNIPISSLEQELISTDELSILETIEAEEEIDSLGTAISQLPEEQIKILDLRFYAGLNHAEIGKKINKSAGASRMIQHRALHTLNQLMRAPVANAKLMGLILAVTFALLTGGVGIASAAARSIPGERLYPLKRAGETGRLWLSPTVYGDAHLQVDYAKRRLEEADSLLNSSQIELAAETYATYKADISDLYALAADTTIWDAADAKAFGETLEVALEEQKVILATTLETASAEGEALIEDVFNTVFEGEQGPSTEENGGDQSGTTPSGSGPEDEPGITVAMPTEAPAAAATAVPADSGSTAENGTSTSIEEAPSIASGPPVSGAAPTDSAPSAEPEAGEVENSEPGRPEDWPADWPWPVDLEQPDPENEEGWVEVDNQWPTELPWPFDPEKEPWSSEPVNWPESWPWPPVTDLTAWPEKPADWPSNLPWPPVTISDGIGAWPETPAGWPTNWPWPPVFEGEPESWPSRPENWPSGWSWPLNPSISGSYQPPADWSADWPWPYDPTLTFGDLPSIGLPNSEIDPPTPAEWFGEDDGTPWTEIDLHWPAGWPVPINPDQIPWELFPNIDPVDIDVDIEVDLGPAGTDNDSGSVTVEIDTSGGENGEGGIEIEIEPGSLEDLIEIIENLPEIPTTLPPPPNWAESDGDGSSDSESGESGWTPPSPPVIGGSDNNVPAPPPDWNDDDNHNGDADDGDGGWTPPPPPEDNGGWTPPPPPGDNGGGNNIPAPPPGWNDDDDEDDDDGWDW